MTAVRVGVVGAGPWARSVHAPTLAAGPETELAGVWARRREPAEALAAAHGVPAFDRYGELLERCDAVAFAVPPAVQPELAMQAARAGKAVLLEKPLADSLAAAEELADVIATAGVGSLVVLTYRFAPGVRRFLDEARSFPAVGGRACFFSGAFLGGDYGGSPWRAAGGALLDVGPHAVDLIDAALGPVTSARAHTSRGGWAGLLLEHRGGSASEVSLCCHAGVGSRTEVEIFGPTGSLACDARAHRGPDTWATLRADFAAVARTGGPHECDVHRGLHLQRIIAEAAARL